MESPPSSKKLSCTPTRSRPSTSAQMRASAPPPALRGGTVALQVQLPVRGRQRLRSSLPLGVSGNASSNTKAAGTMYSGSRLQERAQAAERSCRPRAGHHVGHQPLARPARPPGPAPRPARDRRVRQQRRLDLAQLDAEAADLDLVVQPPQELQVAVRQPAAPDPPCGTGGSPARRRTGRGRTSRRSAPAG